MKLMPIVTGDHDWIIPLTFFALIKVDTIPPKCDIIVDNRLNFVVIESAKNGFVIGQMQIAAISHEV